MEDGWKKQVAMSRYLLKWEMGTWWFIIYFLYFYRYLIFTQENIKNKIKINESVACIGSLNFVPSDMDMPQDASHLLWKFMSSFIHVLWLLNYSNLTVTLKMISDFLLNHKYIFQRKSPVLTFCSFSKPLFLWRR